MTATTIAPGVEITLRAGQQFTARLLNHLGSSQLRGLQVEADDRRVTVRITDDHGTGFLRLYTLRAAAKMLGVQVEHNGFGMHWCNGHQTCVPVLIVTHLSGEVTG